jgi:ATP-dependent Clp protease protease subunit
MSSGLEIAYKNVAKQQEKYNTLYSDIYSHIYIYEEISNKTVERIRNEVSVLSRIQKNIVETAEQNSLEIFTLPKPIVVHMHSPGGDTNAGIALSNIFNYNVPIIVIAEGIVASAATFILVKAKLSYILETAFVLIHQYFGTLSGKQEELKFDINVGNQFMKFLIDMYSKNTKLSKQKLKNMLQHDIFLSANECVKYGIVDNILLEIPPEKHIFYDTKHSFTEFFPEKSIMTKIADMNILSIVKSIEESSMDIFSKALPIVKYIHVANTFKHSIPLVIVLVDRTDSIYFNDIIDILPVINAIYISKLSIYSIILGPITNFTVLVNIMATYRYIHKDAYITLDFVTFSSPSFKYEDTVVNTQFVRNIITSFFLKNTKFPKEMLNKIFKERFIINASDAIKYKFADVII